MLFVRLPDTPCEIEIGFEVEPLLIGPFLSFSSRAYKRQPPDGTAIQLTSASRSDNKQKAEH
jgi:hypothetical protein